MTNQSLEEEQSADSNKIKYGNMTIKHSPHLLAEPSDPKLSFKKLVIPDIKIAAVTKEQSQRAAT